MLFEQFPKPPSTVLLILSITGVAICYMRYPHLVDQAWRDITAGVGGALGLITLYLFLLHGGYYGAVSYERWRIAHNGVIIRMLEAVKGMSDEQLRFIRSANIVRGMIQVSPGEIEWTYQTPDGELDPAWVVNHLNGPAFATWPDLPPIRRLNEGTVEYNNESRFNSWVCSLGLAEKRPGQRFQWVRKSAEVIAALGLAEDAETKLPARHPKRLHRPLKLRGERDEN